MTTKQGIRNTIIAMRECLIGYYYGDCVENLTISMRTSGINTLGLRPTFERDRARLRDRILVMFPGGRTPVFIMATAPTEVTIFTEVFARSPELAAVEHGLREFLAKYLDDVFVINHGGHRYGTQGATIDLPIAPADDTPLVKTVTLNTDRVAIEPSPVPNFVATGRSAFIEELINEYRP